MNKRKELTLGVLDERVELGLHAQTGFVLQLLSGLLSNGLTSLGERHGAQHREVNVVTALSAVGAVDLANVQDELE